MRKDPYQFARYYLLGELRLTRARLRIGTASEAATRKERRRLQGELVKLRSPRSATTGKLRAI